MAGPFYPLAGENRDSQEQTDPTSEIITTIVNAKYKFYVHIFYKVNTDNLDLVLLPKCSSAELK